MATEKSTTVEQNNNTYTKSTVEELARSIAVAALATGQSQEDVTAALARAGEIVDGHFDRIDSEHEAQAAKEEEVERTAEGEVKSPL